jgi:WD40 repeat protein
LAAPPPATSLAYRTDGLLLAASTENRVILIDPKNGDDVGRLPDFQGRVTALAFSRAGLLAVAFGETGKSGTVRVFDLTTGAPIPSVPAAEFSAHKDAIYGLAFSPDGKRLATAGYDRTIKLWDTGQKTPRLTLTDHSDTVYSVAFSPDGRLLASAAADRAVKLWDVATGKRLYTLGEPTDWVYAVAWHPDGKTLAAAGVDKSIRLWEATPDGGRLIRSVFAHERAVTRLEFSPDGKQLFSAGEDRVIKEWDVSRLVETHVFPRQPDAILAFALRPDGKQLAVGRFDGTALFFDTAPGSAGSAFLPVKPKPPAVARVAPDYAARGQTVRVTLSGQRLDLAAGISVSNAAVKATLLPARTPTSRDAELAIPPIAPVGPIQLTLTSPAGSAGSVRFVIDRYAAVIEQGETDSARVAMPITLPTTVLGTIDRAGDTDYFRFEAKAGQAVGAQVVAAAVGSKLDPVLVLTDEGGRVLAEVESGALGYVAPAAGRFAIGIRDREFRGGPDMPYRLHVGDVPVVSALFPLGVQRGREASVHVDGVNLGSPHGLTAHVRVPADAAIGSRVPVPVSLPGGDTPLGSLSVTVGEFPAVIASPESGAELRSVPGTADGILLRAGETQTVRFAARKGDRLIVETQARRLGSPIDPAIEILDAAGKPVPRATLRCTARTNVTFRDHDDATPGIRLDAWGELAANDYLYVGTELIRINTLPPNPDADCNFVQVAGRRVAFLDTTPTHHAQNTPMYKVEIHPPGTTFPPNGMPVFTLFYRNDDGGPGYGKDARLFFDPPADGTYQVRIADSRGLGGPAFVYRLTVRPPRPDFTVAVSRQNPSVWRGGAIPVTVTATRIDGFTGPIDIRLDGTPRGFSAPPTRIEAEQTVTAFALSAAADAPEAATGAARLVARAAIAGKELVREAPLGTPKAVSPGDIVTTTDVSSVSIHPGREARIVATIERRNGFAGRVPLEVRGLPHGVNVLDVGLNGILVTEKDSRREIVLRAEPWVQPMEMPFVVFARHERKGTEHAAAAVMLKVAP